MRMVLLMVLLVVALPLAALAEDRLEPARTAMAESRWDDARRILLLTLGNDLDVETRQRVTAMLAAIDAAEADVPAVDPAATGATTTAPVGVPLSDHQRSLVAAMLALARPSGEHWHALEDLRRRFPDDPLGHQVLERFRPGWATSAGMDDRGSWATRRIGRVLVRFRLIPRGQIRLADGRELRLDQDIWMAEREVTGAVLCAILGSGGDGDELPACGFSADELMAAARVFARDLPAGLIGRLPRPDEWEFAARAGITGPMPPAINSLQDICIESLAPVPVASFAANGYGLHDMHGNVWELVVDRHGQWWRRGGSWRSRLPAIAYDVCLPVARHRPDRTLGMRLVLVAGDTP